MPEIENIITAVTDAYRQFTASGPDRETRVSVRNAVTFLVADLTSAAQLAAMTERDAAKCR
jgi:hypothetical protein